MTAKSYTEEEIRETDPGVYTVDFGQNLAGVCEIRAKGPKGTRIELRHAETVATNGTGRLDPFTIRKAKQLDTFILAGTGAHERFRPRFTYHGFRYVEVRGYPGRLTADDIAMRAVHADVRYTAGVKRLVRGDNPAVGFTEHCTNGVTYVVAVNYSPHPVSCRLNSNGLISRVFGNGAVNDGILSLDSNDGVVMEIPQ